MTEVIGNGEWTGSARYLDGGRLLATAGDDGVVRCWTVEGERQQAFDDQNFNSCRATAGGRLIAGFNGAGGQVAVWSAEGQLLHLLPGHPSAEPRHRTGANTSSAAFSSDGSLLATGGFDDGVRLWDTDDGREVSEFEVGDMVWSLAFSHDDSVVAVGGRNGVVSVWSVDAGVKVTEAKASRGAVTAVCFTPQGELLTGGGKGELRQWRLDGGQLTSRGMLLPPDRAGIEGIAVSPDGRRVAGASRGHWTRVWDVETGDEVTALHRDALSLDVDFSPDGWALVVAGSGPVAIIDIRRALS